MGISKLIDKCSFNSFTGQALVISQSSDTPYLVCNPTTLNVKVEAGVKSSIVLIHNKATEGEVLLDIASNAHLNIVELIEDESIININIDQASNSYCDILTLQLTGGEINYTINLEGNHAENCFNALFATTTSEHSTLKLVINHNVPDCNSKSFIKGVAGGKSVGEFHGLIYIAKDAQRSNAELQNKNIELSNSSRIISKPELEIYADDVKCSHGVTMGQIDTDAILYMRQRGLSENQARKLQTEGFVNDVVARCEIESLYDILIELVGDKLEKM